ncbi:hypothetical protein TWF730_001002 [Orbilia blumenaviensis]|uniref:Uncharacterized protein n=1 Tax=Orbilia blumenaviensis TaxID=1796055 RepID=A0AAV9VPI6_9PEZI
MCLEIGRRALLPLAVALLSQYVNLAVGQEVEELFYIRIHPVLLPGLDAPSVTLRNEFWKGHTAVYLKENLLQGQILGLIDAGYNPAETADPQASKLTEEGLDDLINGRIPTPRTPGQQAVELDYYTLVKYRDPDNRENPSRFILRFANGHRFGWIPYVGLWTQWYAGSELWMESMEDLQDPVFVQRTDGSIYIDGAESWDNFVCRTTFIDEADADTQSESQGGPPPAVWWGFTSLQRSVWQAGKVPRLSSTPFDCIPVAITLAPVSPQTNQVPIAQDILQQDIIEVEEETDSDYGLAPSAEVLSAGNANYDGTPIYFNFEESEPLNSDVLQGGQSNFYSHGNTAQHLFDIEDESGSDEEFNYDAYINYGNGLSPRPSEQVDNSQSEERMQPLEFPESPAAANRALNRANSLAAFEPATGQTAWLQNFPRLQSKYHSTGELSGNGPNGVFLKALATKSDEILAQTPGGGSLKIIPTKSDDVLRD